MRRIHARTHACRDRSTLRWFICVPTALSSCLKKRAEDPEPKCCIILYDVVACRGIYMEIEELVYTAS